MNKKLAVVLVMVLGLLPTSAFGITNPLKSYNLYDDVFSGNGTADPNVERGMGEYYQNSLRAPVKTPTDAAAVAAARQSAEKTRNGLERMANLNKAFSETMNNQSLPQQEKLLRLQSINNQMRNVLETYFADDPEYKNVKQVLDENEKLFATMNDKKMSAEQKKKAMEEHQKKLSEDKTTNAKNPRSLSGSVASFDLDNKDISKFTAVSELQGRNEYLRESSKQVYGKDDNPPRWTEGPSFYAEPTLGSIKYKYMMSNFAGSMQESESYVRKHPKDTLGFYYLAMSYAKCNDKENAIKAYEKVIALNDSPMIVKYATNGRNCVMGLSEAKCYQDVNVPELKYPYAEMAANMDLTPVTAQEIANKNFEQIQNALTQQAAEAVEQAANLPFGTQDASLDAFINAPYGNGFSPELDAEYTRMQLKHIKENINREKDGPGEYYKNFNNIKEFDNSKS